MAKVNKGTNVPTEIVTLEVATQDALDAISNGIATFTELEMTDVILMNESEQTKYFAELQTYLDVLDAENKKYGRGNYTRHLNKFDFILVAIVNAGNVGLTTSKMVKLGRNFIDTKGNVSAISKRSIIKDWNTKNNVQNQRGNVIMNAPTTVKGMEESKREIVNCKFVAISKTAHPNSEIAKGNTRETNENSIFLTQGIENVKEYLLKRGATAESFEA